MPMIKMTQYYDIRFLVTMKLEQIVAGDYNIAYDKNDSILQHQIPGSHEIGTTNTKRHLLVKVCTNHYIIVTNSDFLLDEKYKATWQHLR